MVRLRAAKRASYGVKRPLFASPDARESDRRCQGAKSKRGLIEERGVGSTSSHTVPEHLVRSGCSFLGPCRRAAVRRPPFPAKRPRATRKKFCQFACDSGLILKCADALFSQKGRAWIARPSNSIASAPDKHARVCVCENWQLVHSEVKKPVPPL